MSFCIELFCVVTLQYQILVRIAIAYFIIEKRKAAPQPWQAIAQRFCSTISLSISRIAEMATSAVTNRVKGGQIKRDGKERTHEHK